MTLTIYRVSVSLKWDNTFSVLKKCHSEPSKRTLTPFIPDSEDALQTARMPSLSLL